MLPHSNVDISGQASEDERPPGHTPHAHSQITGGSDYNKSNRLNSNIRNTTSSSELPTPAVPTPAGILSFLPSPIDLWDKRTPTSLLLLPIVLCVYVILQLPLHYNAKNIVRTVADLSEKEWKGRAREVDELSDQLCHVKEILGNVTNNQKLIKGAVHNLKHRIHYLKMRRGQREVYLTTLRQNNNNSAVVLLQQRSIINSKK